MLARPLALHALRYSFATKGLEIGRDMAARAGLLLGMECRSECYLNVLSLACCCLRRRCPRETAAVDATLDNREYSCHAVGWNKPVDLSEL